MEDRDERAQNGTQSCCSDAALHNADIVSGWAKDLTRIQMPQHARTRWNDASAEWRAGEIYKDLSPQAMSELESFAAPHCCASATVLFAEEQEPRSLLLVLDGRVKLSMNSGEGKRLTLGFAVPGDVLGLAAVVTGCPYEITASAQFPCRIRAIPRESFIGLLMRYPVLCQNSTRLLSAEYKRGCDRLRILGLAMTASMKLAMLLLQWCAGGQRTEFGVRIRCSLTHEEIGEYIGISRETVTRNLTDFKNQNLVEQRGSVFFIPSLRSLEIYAGQFGY